MDPMDTIFSYRGLGGCHSRCRVRPFPPARPGHAPPDPDTPQQTGEEVSGVYGRFNRPYTNQIFSIG